MDIQLDIATLPIIDQEEALKLAGNNPELADDLLAMLIKNLPTDLSEIKEAHATNNQIELKQKIHKLRGGVAYCGLPRLKIVLTTIENKLKSQQFDGVATLLEQLNNEILLLLQHQQK